MRRKYLLTLRCKHDGCLATGRYEYDTRKEYARGFASHREWRCLRHIRPASVLSADNRVCTTELVAEQREHGVFFAGAGVLNSGFVSGPGFMAWSADFPPGTRVVITATVTLPEET